MTALELKRYIYEFGCLEESPNGTLCKVADVKAYTQAAVTAAMMAATVKPLEWRRDDRDDGVPEWVSVCYTGRYEIRYSPFGYTAKIVFPKKEATQWGYFGSDSEAKLTVQQHHQKSILSALSTPTDAMAALEAVKAEEEQRGFDRAKERAAQKAHSFLGYLRAGEAPLTFDLAAAIRDMKGSE